MEGSRVQSISPSLPTPSKIVLSHTCLAVLSPVFPAVHSVDETGPSLPIPSKLVTCLAVFSAVHRVDETVAGGKVAGDQRAVHKVHGWVVVHLQW